jgi:hypothetical protein
VGVVVKHLNIPVTDDEHNALADVKGNRNWHDALIEEFGIENNE